MANNMLVKQSGVATAQSASTRRMLALATVVTLIIGFLPGNYSNFIIYPIRLFVTMIHESGHAIAATLTGGRVSYLQINPNGEGVTWAETADWARWIFISGGYLGTTIFGAMLLQVVRFTGWRTTLYLISGYVLTVTLLWAHDPLHCIFTMIVGIVLSVLFYCAGKYLSRDAAGFLVMFVAVQCCLNALGDLRILLYLTTQTNADNDAVFMAQRYLLPPTFWAGLWAISSVIILCASLWVYLRATSKRS